MKSWYKFYFYSISLGLKYLIRNPLNLSKEALKRLIIPMDIARYFEIPATFEYLRPEASERILDISSPKLLSFFIAEKSRSKVVATDIWKKEIDEWKKVKANMFLLQKPIKNLTLLTRDGRKLPYKKNTFNKIFSVSVIEHIEGDGDTTCIKELARVLKPGGVIIITTPFGENYKENWVKRDAYGYKYKGKPLFLSRIYSKKTLQKRLIKPSGLELKQKLVCNEKYSVFSEIYSKLLPFSAFLGLAFPIVALISLRPGARLGAKNNILLVLKKSDDKKT